MCGVGIFCVAIRTHSLSIPRLIDIRHGQQLDTEGFKLSVTHAASANQNITSNTQREETEK